MVKEFFIHMSKNGLSYIHYNYIVAQYLALRSSTVRGAYVVEINARLRMDARFSQRSAKRASYFITH